MYDAIKSRALSFLESRAAKIAPVWAKTLGYEPAPFRVREYLNRSVEELIGSEPDLRRAFGYSLVNEDQLTQYLKSLLINESRRRVSELIRSEQGGVDSYSNYLPASPFSLHELDSEARIRALTERGLVLLSQSPIADISVIDEVIGYEKSPPPTGGRLTDLKVKSVERTNRSAAENQILNLTTDMTFEERIEYLKRRRSSFKDDWLVGHTPILDEAIEKAKRAILLEERKVYLQVVADTLATWVWRREEAQLAHELAEEEASRLASNMTRDERTAYMRGEGADVSVRRTVEREEVRIKEETEARESIKEKLLDSLNFNDPGANLRRSSANILVCASCHEEISLIPDGHNSRNHWDHSNFLQKFRIALEYGIIYDNHLKREAGDRGIEVFELWDRLSSSFLDYTKSCRDVSVFLAKSMHLIDKRLLRNWSPFNKSAVLDQVHPSGETFLSTLLIPVERAKIVGDENTVKFSLWVKEEKGLSDAQKSLISSWILIVAYSCLLDWSGPQKFIDGEILIDEVSPATGKTVTTLLGSLSTSIEAFRDVNLEKVDPDACLEYLNSYGKTVDFLTSGGNSPAAQPYGVSDRGAEFLVRDWMTYFGMVGAEVTDYVGDGGVDVVSDKYVAQVKNYTKSVPIESVRSLFGVATKDGRKPLFFTSGWFSSGAVDFANQVGMALFIYDAKEASCKPSSRFAEQILNGVDQ